MEKPNIRPIKGLTIGVILALGCLVPQLDADTPPSPAPATPAAAPAPTPAQADPFIKKDAAPPADETGPVSNLIVTLEVYKLSQAEGARVLQENDTDEARHARVLDLVKNGKARFDAVLCGAQASGEQANIEQIDIVPYAISFKVLSGKDILADTIKERNVGYRLVVKGQTTADNKHFDEAIFFEHSTLRDFADLRLNINFGPNQFTAAFPQFDTERVNTKPPLFSFEKITFLGTYSPTPSDSLPPRAPEPTGKLEDSGMTLVFEKVSKLQLDPATVKNNQPIAFEHQLSFYSMDRDQALQVLTQKQEMDSAYEAVQSLVKVNQAKLEHLSIIRTQAGMKSNCDEVTEVPVSNGGLNAETETQDVGLSWEIKASFNGHWHAPFLTIDLTQCKLISKLDNLRVPGAAASYEGTRPVFGTQGVTTNINSALGEHELLGTISPPGDAGVNDQKDTGRVWLAFIQTTAVNP